MAGMVTSRAPAASRSRAHATSPLRELSPVGLVHRVAHDGPPVAVDVDLAARLVVHHRGEHGEARVRAHRGHVRGAEARERRRGADRMREGGDDPHALVAPLLVREVLGALVALGDAAPAVDRAVEAPGDDAAGVHAQARGPAAGADRGRRCAARAPRCRPRCAARTTTRAHTSTRARARGRPRRARRRARRVTRAPSCTSAQRLDVGVDARARRRPPAAARPSSAFCFAS